uniref:Uncharacterized protein n=1 Tax=Plectus sambesii TaxID=2011161 RepID=A0A914V407_9BILA
MVTSAIDVVKVAEEQNLLLDNGVENTFNVYLGRVHYVGDFRSAPGSKQLNAMIEELFHAFLILIEAFWWNADEPPYYPAFFNTFSTKGIIEKEFWFGEYFKKQGLKLGCLHSNEKTFLELDDDSYSYEQRRLALVSILNFTLNTYLTFHMNWTNNYIEQALLPFIGILKKTEHDFSTTSANPIMDINIAVLKKALMAAEQSVDMGYSIFEIIDEQQLTISRRKELETLLDADSLRDPALAKYWLPKFILEVQRSFQSAFSERTLAKKLDELVMFCFPV